MREVRDFGWVFVDWRRRVREGEAGVDELDELVFATLGSKAEPRHKAGYFEVPVAEARHIAAHWIWQSLAYGDRLNGSGMVSEVVEPFFQVFSEARYFTNERVPASWSRATAWSIGKTRHTFDSGIVAVDAVHIGMVWFADED